MRVKLKTILAVMFGLLITVQAFAATSFVVKKIDIRGLQRISQGTVLSYLPIDIGDKFSVQESALVIKTLYKTGFFENIKLSRQGNTLVISVKERPIIGTISITGNKAVKTDKLKEVLSENGLAKGRVFDRAILRAIKQSLESEYYRLGFYNAKITTTIATQTRNRVKVTIHVSEGLAAKIAQIKIIGNHHFKTRKLLKQIKLSTSNILSFFNHNDLYTRDKLNADLERLKSFYMDRGYLEFKVVSTQVTVSPDRKGVYIVITINEGLIYKFQGFKLTGKLILPRAYLRKLVKIKKDAPFSRKLVIAADAKIGGELGDIGYAFAKIEPVPSINKQAKTVFITFVVTPGRRYYVRQINFQGNVKTSDEAMRQRLRQFEGGVYSLKKIKESERQLRLTGYLKQVSVKTPKIPGHNNQVNVDYKVKEAPSANAFISAGYGTDGIVFGAGVSQSNFLGTGKYLNVSFNHTTFRRDYSITYNNPYYTVNGVQRGFSGYYHAFRPDELDLSDYALDRYGANMIYKIPVGGLDEFLNLGVGLEHQHLHSSSGSPSQVKEFVDKNGDYFNQGVLSVGWMHNGYDRAIFPRQGLKQGANLRLVFPLDSRSFSYYQFSYNAHYFHPLTPLFILTTRGQVGVGERLLPSSEMPFFENYFVGGIETVRGYETGSLGPRDSSNRPFGGNIMMAGSFGLIINPLSSDNFRTTAFLDAGNAYENKIDEPLRFSAGVQVEWRSPLGPLTFSLAKALNKGKDARTDVFQFTVGTGI